MIFSDWIPSIILLSLVSASTVAIEEELKSGDEKDYYSFMEYFDKAKLFENVAGYNLPVNLKDNQSFHGATSEQIETLKNVSEAAFGDSTFVSPIIRYERPGYVIFPDELQNSCARFRAKKGSISPAAFSPREKLEFVQIISKLGVFEPLNGASSVSMERMELSETLVATHFCRDALRIVASVLNKAQVSWLLEYAPSVVLYNSELMDQLKDFSMFTGKDVCEASLTGHYDWFKNENALRTLPASALLDFFYDLRYDLNEAKELKALNAVRPIRELFEEPEFVKDAFVWQITSGTKYFLNKHINIYNFIRAILGESEEYSVDDIKQAVFSLYVFNEQSITRHVNALIGQFVDKKFLMEDVRNEVEALNYLMDQRTKVIGALKTKFKNSDLHKLFVTPFTLCSRKAMDILEQVKIEEFSGKNRLGIEDLIEALERFETGNFEYFRATAIIFAYLDLTGKPSRLPYCVSTMSTLKLVQTLKLSFSDEVSFPIWPQIFLIEQARDFSSNRDLHIAGKNTDDTLDYIFELLGMCNLESFDARFIQIFNTDYPIKSNSFITKYNEFVSIEARFKEFRNEFSHINKQLSSDQSCDDILDRIAEVSILENELMAVVQNLFKTGMARLLLDDSDLLAAFSEYAHLLKGSQVAELFASEGGILLLSSNRKLLYSLPTYEDIKVAHLEPLKFQAQCANMLRTVPVNVLLESFKNDKYIFNDPLGVSWRLFSCADRIKDNDLVMNAWRIAPAQFFAEAWNQKVGIRLEWRVLYLVSSTITNYMIEGTELNGKILEMIRSILHWIILQELKFVEAFTLMCSKVEKSFDVKSKKQHAYNAAVYAHQSECKAREDLGILLSKRLESNPKFNTPVISKEFIADFLNLLKSPLSQIRAGALLAGAGAMDKNIRFYKFDMFFNGFTEWVEDIKRTFVSVSMSKFISEKTKTNISLFREIIDDDMKTRHVVLSNLLDRIDKALGIKAKDSEIWKDRVRLLGMMSADGFTINKFFKTSKKLNLPIHETIIHRKWMDFIELTWRKEIPEEAVTIFLGNTKVDSKDTKVDSKDTNVDTKTKNRKKKKKLVTLATDGIIIDSKDIVNEDGDNVDDSKNITMVDSSADFTDYSKADINAIAIEDIDVDVVDSTPDIDVTIIDHAEYKADSGLGLADSSSDIDVTIIAPSSPKADCTESKVDTNVDSNDSKAEIDVNIVDFTNPKVDSNVVIKENKSRNDKIKNQKPNAKKNKKSAFNSKNETTIKNTETTIDSTMAMSIVPASKNVTVEDDNAEDTMATTYLGNVIDKDATAADEGTLDSTTATSSIVIDNTAIGVPDNQDIMTDSLDISDTCNTTDTCEIVGDTLADNSEIADNNPVDSNAILNPVTYIQRDFIVVHKDLLDLELLELSLSINSHWCSGRMNFEEIAPLLFFFWERIGMFTCILYHGTLCEWIETNNDIDFFNTSNNNIYITKPTLMHPKMEKTRLTLESPICKRAMSVAIGILSPKRCAALFRNAPIEILDDSEILNYLPDYSEFTDSKSIQVLVEIFSNKWQKITEVMARSLPIVALHKVIETRNFDISREELNILLVNRFGFNLQGPFTSDHRTFRMFCADSPWFPLPTIDIFFNRDLDVALIESILAYYVHSEILITSTISSIVDIWSDDLGHFIERVSILSASLQISFSERKRLIAALKIQLGKVSCKLVKLLETPLDGRMKAALRTDNTRGALLELFSYTNIKESIPYKCALKEETLELWSEVIVEAGVCYQFRTGRWVRNFLKLFNYAALSEHSEKYEEILVETMRRHQGALTPGHFCEFDWFLLAIKEVFGREAGRIDGLEKEFRITRELKKILDNVWFDPRIIEAIWDDHDAMRALLEYPDCLDQGHVDALVKTSIGNELLRANPRLLNSLPTYVNFSLEDMNRLNLRLDSGALAIGTLGVETTRAWLEQERMRNL